MAGVTRLPTKFGQGHSEGIGFIQDEVLEPFIRNEIVTLVIVGLTSSGDEIRYMMNDVSGAREWNQRTLGVLADVQAEWRDDMRQQATGED